MSLTNMHRHINTKSISIQPTTAVTYLLRLNMGSSVMNVVHVTAKHYLHAPKRMSAV
jgi:hypothetical protein